MTKQITHSDFILFTNEYFEVSFLYFILLLNFLKDHCFPMDLNLLLSCKCRFDYHCYHFLEKLYLSCL